MKTKKSKKNQKEKKMIPLVTKIKKGTINLIDE